MARRDGGRVFPFSLLRDGFQVQRGDAEGCCAGFCGSVQFRREDPLVWPLEDGGVGRGGMGVVVLAGDVEGEVEEGLAARFDKRGETISVSLSLPLNSKETILFFNARDIVRPLYFIQTLIRIPCSVRILAKVIHDLPEPAHPRRPIFQGGQFIYQRNRQSISRPLTIHCNWPKKERETYSSATRKDHY